MFAAFTDSSARSGATVVFILQVSGARDPGPRSGQDEDVPDPVHTVCIMDVTKPSL